MQWQLAPILQPFLAIGVVGLVGLVCRVAKRLAWAGLRTMPLNVPAKEYGGNETMIDVVVTGRLLAGVFLIALDEPKLDIEKFNNGARILVAR
jgi:hypothetical protein